MGTNAIEDLKSIFAAALSRVDPYKMITEHMKIAGNILEVQSGNETKQFDLDGYDAIYVFGAGKAAAPMAKAVEEILDGRIAGGVLSLKKGHEEIFLKLETILSGHPFPDNHSVMAAEKMIGMAKKFTDRTLVVNLISGGGSALLEMPLSSGIADKPFTIGDIAAVTKILLECGADINETNCIRKHLSGIKGGKFARIIYPATSINLILSDVVGDSLDTIASGLTVRDNSSFHDAYVVVKKYGLEDKFPENVMNLIKAEAGKSQSNADNGPFLKTNNFLIGTNRLALGAASKKAEGLGYHTLVLTSQLSGEAKEAAKFLAGIAFDIHEYDEPVGIPACIITGGETTVTVKGKGKGGRNQELALSYLAELKKKNLSADILLLSASTDGNDGPTDAAGAFASRQILEEAKENNLELNDYLADNDSYVFFEKTGGLYKTGPTNTNVCDIQIQLIL